MNAHTVDPQARLIRSAVFWARMVSNQFDDACAACLGNMMLVVSPFDHRIEGKTTTGGTVLISIEGGQLVLRRFEPTYTTTLRRDLPANLLRRSGFTPTLPDAQRAN
jgi:hypothetical protein